jgi:GNAT superfamily N-acetyltransferase
MIRRANMGDITAIVEIGRAAYEKSAYAHLFGAFNEYEAKMELVRYVGDVRDSLVLVCERTVGIDGFIVMTTCRLPFSSLCYASDVAFCSKGGRGVALLREARKWAKRREMPLMLGNGFGDARTDALYQRLGLQRAGGLYTE